jgi:hypothetical protein
MEKADWVISIRPIHFSDPVFLRIRADPCSSVATSYSLLNAFNKRHWRMSQDVGPELVIVIG